jgi:hypothetical protein
MISRVRWSFSDDAWDGGVGLKSVNAKILSTFFLIDTLRVVSDTPFLVHEVLLLFTHWVLRQYSIGGKGRRNCVRRVDSGTWIKFTATGSHNKVTIDSAGYAHCFEVGCAIGLKIR